MRIQQQLQQASARLATLPGINARLEAELLLAHALGRDRSWLYAHSEDELDAPAGAAFAALLAGRLAGQPVAYLTGRQEFWSLPLQVSPAVLIPRPETELLVEAALARLAGDKPVSVADIGTGSGAIALAIASERPRATVHASDISAAALEVAQANAQRLELDVRFYRGSWCSALPGRYDLIASNPPYVRAGDPHLQRGDLRFEPAVALSPGDDELLAFRAISREARSKLEPGGWLLFEHGHEQGAAVRAVLVQNGFLETATLPDLAGLDRVTLGRQPPGGA